MSGACKCGTSFCFQHLKWVDLFGIDPTYDLPDLGATTLPPEANTAPNLATSPSESGNSFETPCPGPAEAHYWLGGPCPWCKAAI